MSDYVSNTWPETQANLQALHDATAGLDRDDARGLYVAMLGILANRVEPESWADALRQVTEPLGVQS